MPALAPDINSLGGLSIVLHLGTLLELGCLFRTWLFVPGEEIRRETLVPIRQARLDFRHFVHTWDCTHVLVDPLTGRKMTLQSYYEEMLVGQLAALVVHSSAVNESPLVPTSALVIAVERHTMTPVLSTSLEDRWKAARDRQPASTGANHLVLSTSNLGLDIVLKDEGARHESPMKG